MRGPPYRRSGANKITTSCVQHWSFWEQLRSHQFCSGGLPSPGSTSGLRPRPHRRLGSIRGFYPARGELEGTLLLVPHNEAQDDFLFMHLAVDCRAPIIAEAVLGTGAARNRLHSNGGQHIWCTGVYENGLVLCFRAVAIVLVWLTTAAAQTTQANGLSSKGTPLLGTTWNLVTLSKMSVPANGRESRFVLQERARFANGSTGALVGRSGLMD
jgi:hypothetical protein